MNAELQLLLQLCCQPCAGLPDAAGCLVTQGAPFNFWLLHGLYTLKNTHVYICLSIYLSIHPSTSIYIYIYRVLHKSTYFISYTSTRPAMVAPRAAWPLALGRSHLAAQRRLKELSGGEQGTLRQEVGDSSAAIWMGQKWGNPKMEPW